MIEATESSVDLVFNSILENIKKEDYDSAKNTIEELTSQNNAYTHLVPFPGLPDPRDRWNMITYKKGKKSLL